MCSVLCSGKVYTTFIINWQTVLKRLPSTCINIMTLTLTRPQYGFKDITLGECPFYLIKINPQPADVLTELCLWEVNGFTGMW